MKEQSPELQEHFIKEIDELMRDIDAGIKYYEIYPLTHPLVTQITNKAYFTLVKLMENYDFLNGFVNLTRVDGRLFANEKPLPPTFRSQLYKKFNETMSRNDVDNITFINGLAKEEAAGFFEVLSQDPEDRDLRGGLYKLLESRKVLRIRINTLHLSSLAGHNDDGFIFHFFAGDLNQQERDDIRPTIRELLRVSTERCMNILVSEVLISASNEEHNNVSKFWDTTAREVSIRVAAIIEELYKERSWEKDAAIISHLIKGFPEETLNRFNQLPVSVEGNLKRFNWRELNDVNLVSEILLRYDCIATCSSLDTELTESMNYLTNMIQANPNEIGSASFNESISSFRNLITDLGDQFSCFRHEIENVTELIIQNGEIEKGVSIMIALLNLLESSLSDQNLRLEITETLDRLIEHLYQYEDRDAWWEFFNAVIAFLQKEDLPQKIHKPLRSRVIEGNKLLLYKAELDDILSVQYHLLNLLESSPKTTPSTYLIIDLLIDLGKQLTAKAEWENLKKFYDKLGELINSDKTPLLLKDSMQNARVEMIQGKGLDDLFNEIVNPVRKERVATIHKIEKLGDMFIPHILKNLDHPNWHYRRNLLIILQKIGSLEIIEKIIPLLTDMVWQVRKEAVRTIGLLCENKWEELKPNVQEDLAGELINSVIDDHEQVRFETFKVINLLKPSGSTEKLAEVYRDHQQISDKDPDFSARMIETIGRISVANRKDTVFAMKFFREILNKKETLFSKAKTIEQKKLVIQALGNMNIKASLNELEDQKKKTRNPELKSMINESLKKINA